MAFYVGNPVQSGRTRPVSSRRRLEGSTFVSPWGYASYWTPPDPADYGSLPGRAALPDATPPPLDTAQTGRYGRVPNPYALNAVLFGQMNQGEMLPEFEDQRYLGGFPDDYASQTRVSVPYAGDNLSMRYHAYQRRPPTKMVYGRPIYREGMQATFASRLSVDQIRSWQVFFQANGFSTGPSGFWTEFEMNAMKAFMTMANGTPGGGMDVNVLRARVEQAVQAGELQAGALAPALGITGAGLNERAVGAAGAGATGDELEPYTETTVTRQPIEFSTEQGMLLLRSELSRQLGRRPTEQEVGQFTKALNAAQRADPLTITSVVNVNPVAGTREETSTRKESSADPEAMAATFATENVDQAELQGYQSQRFLEALISELGF